MDAETGDWSTTEVRTLLADYGRNPRDLAVAAMPEGSENRNLLIAADGERLVLRRYDATPPDEVPWELALLRFLSAKDFPTARLVERVDGGLACTLGGRPAALFSFVTGRHPACDAPGMVDQVAGVIARLHAVTNGLWLPQPRSRMDSRYRLAQFQSWLRERPSASDEPALVSFAAQVEQFAAAFAARLAPHEAMLPRGVVHHDAHVGNLLCDEAGQIVALLDFDDAHETYLLADVAVLVDVWGTDQETRSFSPVRAAGMVRAYAQHRPLGAAEWELLPDFLALYHLADVTSYVSGRVQAGVPGDQALADCNQYAKFLQHTAAPDWRDQLRAALTSQ